MIEQDEPIPRDLLSGGYWAEVHGDPAADGRQKRRLYDPNGTHLTTRFGTLDDCERWAVEHKTTGQIPA
jgi:hypothetical protein